MVEMEKKKSNKLISSDRWADGHQSIWADFENLAKELDREEPGLGLLFRKDPKKAIDRMSELLEESSSFD
jgi:hypothetical protein